MNPFQAIRATIDMLLARARQPSGAHEMIPAPLVVRHRHPRAERSTESERAADRPLRREPIAVRSPPAGRLEPPVLRLKRAYEPQARGDGRRVLVDRLWPRGVSKERLAIDDWMKELAPSTGLRRWFAHDPAKWVAFQRLYALELEARRISSIAWPDMRSRDASR